MPSSVVRGRLLSILGFSNFAAPREVMRAAYARMCEHAAAGDLVVELEEIPLEDVAAAWERQAASPGQEARDRPLSRAAGGLHVPSRPASNFPESPRRQPQCRKQ